MHRNNYNEFKAPAPVTQKRQRNENTKPTTIPVTSRQVRMRGFDENETSSTYMIQASLGVMGEVRIQRLPTKDNISNLLLHTVAADSASEVRKLFVSDPDRFCLLLNIQDSFGYTPLHTAVAKVNKEICIMLINAGADITLTNSAGQSVLALAESIYKLGLRNATPDNQDILDNAKYIYEALLQLTEQQATIKSSFVNINQPLNETALKKTQ